MADLNELMARLEKLEDLEAIRRLKHKYCGHCDNEFQAGKIAALFTDDGVWEAGEPWGNFVGREAIAEFFRGMPEAVSFSVHALSNEEIDIDGDTATARWRTVIPVTLNSEDGGVSHWMFCDYTDEYKKVDGHWLFSRIKADVLRSGDHAEGWSQDADG